MSASAGRGTLGAVSGRSRGRIPALSCAAHVRAAAPGAGAGAAALPRRVCRGCAIQPTAADTDFPRAGLRRRHSAQRRSVLAGPLTGTADAGASAGALGQPGDQLRDHPDRRSADPAAATVPLRVSRPQSRLHVFSRRAAPAQRTPRRHGDDPRAHRRRISGRLAPRATGVPGFFPDVGDRARRGRHGDARPHATTLLAAIGADHRAVDFRRVDRPAQSPALQRAGRFAAAPRGARTETGVAAADRRRSLQGLQRQPGPSRRRRLPAPHLERDRRHRAAAA